MKIRDYAEVAISTLGDGHEYGELTPQFMAQVLGLVGESGEVAEKFKKIIRDKNGVISSEERDELVKELGDILWYVNAVAHLLGSSLEEVAKKNNEKLMNRKERGVLRGAGDNR